MPLPTIPSGNVASALPTGYNIDNSCRFNSADSAYMHRTFGTPTNVDKWTWSAWIKRGKVSTGAAMKLFNAYVDGNAYHMIHWSGGTGADQVGTYVHDTSGGTVDNGQRTSGLYRDPSAWYHVCAIYDSGNASATLRSRFFINGVEPSFSSDDNPSANQDSVINRAIAHQLGAVQTPAQYFDGYMAEVIFCDGQAYTPDNFGEYDEDSPTIWKPKDPSGVTFGDNGFWLNFQDSADLGKDVSGQGNHFTEVNFAATDQATDTPTNNFCTLNPLDMYYINSSSLAEGNCKWTGSTQYGFGRATVALTKGKWYFEVKMTNYDSADSSIGITGAATASSTNWLGNGTHQYGYIASAGSIYHGNSGTAHGDTYGEGDIIGCYFDLDNNKLYFSKNGTLQNSGTGHSITAASSTTDGAYSPAFGDSCVTAGHVVQDFNFGGCPAFAISSGNTDGDYGNFEYSTTITGDGSSKTFKAICTKNIAEYG